MSINLEELEKLFDKSVDDDTKSDGYCQAIIDIKKYIKERST